MKKRQHSKKSRGNTHAGDKITFTIDINSLHSLIQGLMDNAVTNMLSRDGYVFPHFVAVVGSQLRVYPMPVGNDRDIELHKKHVPEFLNTLGAKMAAVVRDGRYRMVPLLAPRPLTPVDADPNSQTCIIVEAADINNHKFVLLPYHRNPDGGVLFEDQVDLNPGLVNEIFLADVKFVGKKVDPSVRELFGAAGEGDLSLVSKLLDSGVDVNAEFSNTTPLMRAAAAGQTRVGEELLRRGANVDAATPQGWTPLMVACLHGHAEMARLLLDHGASVNAKWSHYGEYGGTALMAAALKGFTNIMGLLLERGAHIAMRDEIGGTALSEAAVGGHLKAVELLMANGADQGDQIGAFIAASARGHERIAEYFVARGLDVNATGPDKITALMAASQYGHGKLVNILLELGADPCLRDSEGETARDKARVLSIRQTLATAMNKNKQGASTRQYGPSEVSA